MSTELVDEIPAVCETCLGTNPYLRMMKEKQGLECKLCTRPFTVFKWAPEKNGAFKHTTICLTCARQRNCCQSCLLDLTYGIPIQLRDAALKIAGVGDISSSEPSNQISKLYVANNSEKFDKLGGASITSNSEKAKEILTKLALATKGKTSKKEQVKEQSLPSHIENIDVTKIVSKLPFNGSLSPPSDTNITTLFIFGIDESLPEYKITDFFETFGKIKSFNCQHKAKAGFLTFTKRSEAEKATKSITAPSDKLPGLILIDSIPLRVTWGKERPLGKTSAEKLKVGSIVNKVIKKLVRSSNPKDHSKASQKQISDGNDRKRPNDDNNNKEGNFDEDELQKRKKQALAALSKTNIKLKSTANDYER